jgi:hypothetical protein
VGTEHAGILRSARVRVEEPVVSSDSKLATIYAEARNEDH